MAWLYLGVIILIAASMLLLYKGRKAAYFFARYIRHPYELQNARHDPHVYLETTLALYCCDGG